MNNDTDSSTARLRKRLGRKAWDQWAQAHDIWTRDPQEVEYMARQTLTRIARREDVAGHLREEP